MFVDVDVCSHGNNRGSSSSRAPAEKLYDVSYTRRLDVTSSANQPSPARLRDVTSSRRRDSPPRDERRVTFADDSPVMVSGSDVGGPDDDQIAGNSSRFGSSEFSDVTSVTSGSYYIGEDSYQQPVSFIFV